MVNAQPSISGRYPNLGPDLLVASGRFRADLFYRLNVLSIHAPPLRERAGDIEALVYAMLEELSADARPRHAGQFVLHDDALQLDTARDPARLSENSL